MAPARRESQWLQSVVLSAKHAGEQVDALVAAAGRQYLVMGNAIQFGQACKQLLGLRFGISVDAQASLLKFQQRPGSFIGIQENAAAGRLQAR